MDIFNKPYIKRALRTFLQTALGYAVMNITVIDLNAKNALAGLCVSAIAAGAAAVMNLNEGKNSGADTPEYRNQTPPPNIKGENENE